MKLSISSETELRAFIEFTKTGRAVKKYLKQLSARFFSNCPTLILFNVLAGRIMLQLCFSTVYIEQTYRSSFCLKKLLNESIITILHVFFYSR